MFLEEEGKRVAFLGCLPTTWQVPHSGACRNLERRCNMAAKKVGIGHQNFEQLIQANCFYIDKTDFIREWWENKDAVTLITRPRRFGKTLNMSMLEHFFSVKYAGRGDLFEGFSIWREKSADSDYQYRQLQGTYPVISLSFANIKEQNYQNAREKMCKIMY